MVSPSPEVTALIEQLHQRLAGMELTPALAKLYSQHTLLSARRNGLSAWRQDEGIERFEEALQLIDAALIQRQQEDNRWRDSMRRAGEILEWLSHPGLLPKDIPISLLTAATYQIAGYPARASGLLNSNIYFDTPSQILAALLKTDFYNLTKLISTYWKNNPTYSSQTNNTFSNNLNSPEEVHNWIVKEIVSALGILCSYMRWGEETRVERAINKLESASKVLIHSHNTYSWLLSKLSATVARTYYETSLRKNLEGLLEETDFVGKNIFEKYMRSSYRIGKTLIWPSQLKGIERLVQEGSFALCTPTGSGKTTIAEIAIFQSLFNTPIRDTSQYPLVIYLVPKKALATEVESKLSKICKTISSSQQPVTVTGLYGGTDWGPTDVWVTNEQRTILICTYEKAEALMKFLGPVLLRRIRLVVIDEAHNVQFSGSQKGLQDLQNSEDRALRLEALGTRFLSYLENSQCRFIALSAVAADSEIALTRWISGAVAAEPIKTSYRSTRQLIGRLICQAGRRFEIQYDLLDGNSLEFSEQGRIGRPYIPNPFSPFPPTPSISNKSSIGIELRPYLLWAAINLASPDESGRRKSVLISVPAHPEWYAGTLLELLRSDWANVDDFPNFFQPPEIGTDLAELWEKCKEACKDYFTERSKEYRLLVRGVAIHHGKMPGLLARLLVEVIEKRIITLVIATSTLSEGVNLPFETVLIPEIARQVGQGSTPLSIQEFSNLVGRAGRPGFATEGRSLIVMPSTSLETPENEWQIRNIRQNYSRLLNQMTHRDETRVSQNPRSPLAELIKLLEENWSQLSGASSQTEFYNWLEETIPIEISLENENQQQNDLRNAVEALDSLDSFLLAIIVELEMLLERDLIPSELEHQLQLIWRKTYARYAASEEENLERIFIFRGTSLKNSVYTNSTYRRELYKTSLPPRTGNRLLNEYSDIREHLLIGSNYVDWEMDEKFRYIHNITTAIGRIEKFRIEEPSGNSSSEEILKWWLCHIHCNYSPTEGKISRWHKHISENYQYRFCWGLGSVIALAIQRSGNDSIAGLSLESWEDIGLPWIVFWLKELINWGTLDPVAAYLLARVEEVSNRQMAEEVSRSYYQYAETNEFEEKLNARYIRDWASRSFSDVRRSIPENIPPIFRNVTLLRDFSRIRKNVWPVVPVTDDYTIHWYDLAGYPLASSSKPDNWESSFFDDYDFELDSDALTINRTKYL